MRKEKQDVKEFYNAFGWQKNAGGIYNDTATWFDLSPTTSSYQHRCLSRTKHFFKASGTYFLNAGSGAIQHREHLEYSSTYKWHICLDLSMTALNEARLKLGGRGLYILGDLTSLPFKEETIDGAICSEVLFHVPADEQESAVRELHRVLRHRANCVIIYMWPACFLSTIAEKAKYTRQIIARIFRKILRVRFLKNLVDFSGSGHVPTNNNPPPLYFHANDYRWFQQTFPRDWNIDIRSFRSADESFMASVIPHNSMGELFLKLVFWCEEVLPHLFGRIGSYPMIVITKR